MAGIIGFVRNIALEVARDNIRVNCVTPSFVAETAIFERFSQVAEGRAQAASRRPGWACRSHPTSLHWYCSCSGRAQPASPAK
jgi:NAD(P)-dependent dehydrogenase (short-subunit alcohol dehydrogenase family)